MATLNKLTQVEAGQESVENWFNWPIQPTAVAEMADVLVPVQEMSRHQRRFRDADLRQALLATEKFLASRRVPNDEIWKLIALQITHDDSIQHVVDVRGNSPLAPGTSWDFARQIVSAGVSTAIYPAIPHAVASPNQFNVRGGDAPIWLPGDLFSIVDETAANDANVIWIVSLRYEILPKHFLHEADNAIATFAI